MNFVLNLPRFIIRCPRNVSTKHILILVSNRSCLTIEMQVLIEDIQA